MNLNKYIEEASEEIMEKAYADPMFYKELEDAVRKALTAYNNDVVELISTSPYRDGKTYTIDQADKYWEKWQREVAKELTQDRPE